MGIERTAMSAKVSREIEDFLCEWSESLLPYRVPPGSLLERCGEIVMAMVHSGELSLEPTALQDFLRQRRNGRNESNGSNGLAQITEEHAGKSWSEVKAGKALKR